MTVKEMIEKLQVMNPEAVIIVDDAFGINVAPAIDEVEQSPDKKYVRVW